MSDLIERLGYWPPYILALAGALLALVSAAPLVVPPLALRRRYQPIVMAAWLFLGLAVGLVVIISSPWLILGLVLVFLIAGVVSVVKQRMESRLEQESLAFLQGLVGLMAAGDGILEALRKAAQNVDFARVYPRMTRHVQEVIGYVNAGKPLSTAANLVADGAAAPARRVWNRVSILARIVEDGQGFLTVEAQRDTMQSLWAILSEVHNINVEMRREMANMEMAKWVFTLIIPGMNVVTARYSGGYLGSFVRSAAGQAVLALEAIALVSIFVIFSRLQKLPEVRA